MPDTLPAPVSHSQDVKHSRFLAHAAPIDGPEQALDFVRQVTVAEATHNCWAYRHGGDYRSSDDGEPAGTAGRPILAAIDGQGFDRVVVVVTRWYGGIKLGAGGLVRAYGGTAAECLRTAPRLALTPMTEGVVHSGFDDIGVVHALLAQHAASKRDEVFDPEGVRLCIQLPSDRLQALKTRLRDATRNRVSFTETDPHE